MSVSNYSRCRATAAPRSAQTYRERDYLPARPISGLNVFRIDDVVISRIAVSACVHRLSAPVYYLRRRRRLCFRCGLFVCLSVCPSDYSQTCERILTNFFWSGRAWLKDQVIQFWWRSGSCFGSGSPKSEIRILRIGGGLCSLSIAFLLFIPQTSDCA